jgi:hypothetical protein
MTEAEFRSLYAQLKGQLPWGPDERRGAFNYITPAEFLAAPAEHWPAADNPDPARHQMKGPWDAAGARTGLHPEVLPLLAQRRIAALGSDGNNDTAPAPWQASSIRSRSCDAAA